MFGVENTCETKEESNNGSGERVGWLLESNKWKWRNKS